MVIALFVRVIATFLFAVFKVEINFSLHPYLSWNIMPVFSKYNLLLSNRLSIIKVNREGEIKSNGKELKFYVKECNDYHRQAIWQRRT